MTGVSDQAVGEQSTASQVKGTVQEGMQGAKERVQETAQQARGQLSGQMRTQVDQRSTQMGEQAQSVAQAIRRTSEQLRGEGQDRPASVAEGAAERVERLGTYLRDSSSDRILNDVEDFARRQPWAIALGGAALGFLASRLLKASSTSRYEATYGGGTFSYGRGYVSPAERELPAPPPPLAEPTSAVPSRADADIVA